MKEVSIISKIVGRAVDSMKMPSAAPAASVDLSGYLPKSEWNAVWEVRETDEGARYVLGKLPVVLQYGLTMYADDGDVDLPGIYDGLPIDNQTLYWEDVDGVKVLKAKGGGIEYPLTWSGYSSGSYDGTEAKNIYIPSKVSELSNDSLFINLSDLEYYIEQGGYITDYALDGYATEDFVTGRGYITSSALNGYATEDFVTGRGYITSSALNGYATESYVTSRGYITASALSDYLPKSGGTITGNLYINAPIITNSGIKGNFWEIKDLDGNPYLKLIHHGNWFIQGYDGYLYLGMGAAKSLKIDSSGNGDFVGKIGCVGSINVSGLSGVNTSINIYSYDNSGFQFSNRITESGQLRIYYRNSGGTFTSLFELSKTGNMLVTGGITMYSDERKKTILNHVQLSLRDVADAPLIEHYYNSDAEKTTHVGSIAQYWARLNDWFCKMDSEGFYTMEVQNAALASAISVARELLKYETKTDRQIRKLKKRISELEEEVELLKKI